MYLSLAGALDAAAAAQIEDEVLDHLAEGCQHIRLDASSVVHIDEEALDLLAHAARQCRVGGAQLTMCGVSRSRLFRPLLVRAQPAPTTSAEGRAGPPLRSVQR